MADPAKRLEVGIRPDSEFKNIINNTEGGVRRPRESVLDHVDSLSNKSK